MDAKLRFRLFNSAPVTALSYHCVRREIVTGHRDGQIKTWEADTGKNSLVLNKHIGMITGIVYSNDCRLMISCSIDGLIVQWASSGATNGSIDINQSIYSICLFANSKRILIGCNTSLIVLKSSDKYGTMGLPLLEKAGPEICTHTDIIKCIATKGNRVYTAGYDRRLCIYETLSYNLDQLCLVNTKEDAHLNAITCLKVSEKLDSIFTGSFDHQVKVWTGDGKLLYSIQLLDTVSDVELVSETNVLWVATINSDIPFHYDAKSGNKISEFLDPSHSMKPVTKTERNQSCSHYIQTLKYVADTSDLLGLLSSKEVVLLHYNPNATICCHQIQWEIECMTYTKKIPILLFTGTGKGEMIKWERMQLNRYDYSKELLSYEEALKSFLNTDSGQKNLSCAVSNRSANKVKGDELHGELSVKESEVAEAEIMKSEHRSFMKSVFAESVDYLVASCRDGKIFVWGFDKKSAEALRSIYSEKHLSSLTENLGSTQSFDEDQVTYNRVAGFTIQYILEGHFQPVQALAVVEHSTKTDCICLLSAGWDLCINIWNLNSGELTVHLSDCIPSTDDYHDLLITDIAYTSYNDTFVFTATNHFAYMMSFSLNQSEICLLKTFAGHSNEVTQVCWNPSIKHWITGSCDHTIRLWSATDGVCVDTIHTNGRVHVLVIDPDNRLIIAGVGESINVYDQELELVQICNGHTENISDIIFLPEESQYISVSHDKTLRIWSSYAMKKKSSQGK